MSRGERLRSSLRRESQAEVRKAKNQLKENVKSAQWWKQITQITIVIAGYFISSISLTFFQKRVIAQHHFPVTIVICHLILKFLFAGLGRSVLTYFTGQERVVLSWRNYLSRVALVAFCSAIDIGLSQWSFEFIGVTLYTMTKTSTVLFILSFAVCLGLEKKHWSLIVIVSMIAGGLFLFVYESTVFNMTGFLMVLFASLSSGARWTFSQLIMQKSKLGLSNPIDLVYHIQPLMIMCLIPIFGGFEGMRIAASAEGFRFSEVSTLLNFVYLVLFGGVLAFIMEVFEFFVVTEASSLTLSVVGIFKEVCTILVDTVIHDKSLSTLNIIGMIVCILGLALHVFNKAVKSDFSSPSSNGKHHSVSSAAAGGGRSSEFSLPLLSDNNSDDDFSSDEEELFTAGGGGLQQNGGGGASRSGYRAMADDFYLKDNRQWTGVRELHLQRAEEQLDVNNTGQAVPDVLLDKENKEAPPSPLLNIGTTE